MVSCCYYHCPQTVCCLIIGLKRIPVEHVALHVLFASKNYYLNKRCAPVPPGGHDDSELENTPLTVQYQTSASRYLSSLVTHSHLTSVPTLREYSVPLSAALRLGFVSLLFSRRARARMTRAGRGSTSTCTHPARPMGSCLSPSE